jgi:threonine dehydratase
VIALEDVQAAANRLASVIAPTPFAFGPQISQLSGLEVYLKKENLQNTGSFKIRGAFNRIAMLDEATRQKGVIAASAGNHAQGVAFSANYFGVPSYIVMPEATPLLKVSGAKALGAEVILHGANYDEAYAYARAFADERAMTLVHPFADEGVMAGQGTLALEMIECVPDLDVLIVPVGGGGLISGVAMAAKALQPDITVIGVTAAGAPAMRNSFLARRAQDSLGVRTIADGIAVRDTSELTLNYLLKYVDDVVEVDDEEIANAILFLLERQKLVVEGAGAAAIAALMHHRIPIESGKKVGVLLSGGNIDVTMLSVIIEKGLIKSQRKMRLTVTLIDKPGSLERLAGELNAVNANIVHIDYDRIARSLEFGDAYVSVSLETKGAEHQEQIRAQLSAAGFQFTED